MRKCSLDAKPFFGDPEVQGVLKVLGRSGVSDVLRSLEKGPRRFSQLVFESRLNPSALSKRLRALQELAIVEKSQDMYRLTDRGRRITNVLRAFFEVVE
ncbi:winged helix-turn-helix transcriptional regulator [Archaeoglobus neptunius]|uniref:winged helix-turn-helix transcriptional regulator n=1 Tax=Archaeoglobus neptunius TaxID=2798580 RepID=UPI001926EEFE|nr:winged helix-turn-helix domain-containing protein [Archaeoglobus neptunius]